MKLRALGLVWGQDLYGPLLHWTPYAVKWIAYESEPDVFVDNPPLKNMRPLPMYPRKLSEFRPHLFSRGKGSR